MLAMRRILVSILLAALLTTAVGSFVQARRTDASSDPGWVEDAGPPDVVVTTPMTVLSTAVLRTGGDAAAGDADGADAER